MVASPRPHAKAGPREDKPGKARRCTDGLSRRNQDCTLQGSSPRSIRCQRPITRFAIFSERSNAPSRSQRILDVEPRLNESRQRNHTLQSTANQVLLRNGPHTVHSTLFRFPVLRSQASTSDRRNIRRASSRPNFSRLFRSRRGELGIRRVSLRRRVDLCNLLLRTGSLDVHIRFRNPEILLKRRPEDRDLFLGWRYCCSVNYWNAPSLLLQFRAILRAKRKHALIGHYCGHWRLGHVDSSDLEDLHRPEDHEHAVRQDSTGDCYGGGCDPVWGVGYRNWGWGFSLGISVPDWLYCICDCRVLWRVLAGPAEVDPLHDKIKV